MASDLQKEINEALLDKQDEIGLTRGGPNLWPGTAAAVATEVAAKWLDALAEKKDAECDEKVESAIYDTQAGDDI